MASFHLTAAVSRTNCSLKGFLTTEEVVNETKDTAVGTLLRYKSIIAARVEGDDTALYSYFRDKWDS